MLWKRQPGFVITALMLISSARSTFAALCYADFQAQGSIPAGTLDEHSFDLYPPFTVKTADLQGIANGLRTSTFSSPPAFVDSRGINLPHFNNENFHLGTAQVCWFNTDLFQSTHVALSVAADDVDNIIGSCCAGLEDCPGGVLLQTGDTGLNVTVAVQPAGAAC
ncbi:hypothetical protein PV08_09106 [Exophiala spinifera]|uniref:Ecp2 effector protein domain-containing protein n=1 Tax=Exophiala spinifera TaxID=91928 RepID=A0A0D2AYN4_9EURO|nr:uncharacterized protein PV08_09106 [Exophiala spinifera]KIW11833.1 hypothetical protein PV08_09106 [Exophiala spinifera]